METSAERTAYYSKSSSIAHGAGELSVSHPTQSVSPSQKKATSLTIAFHPEPQELQKISCSIRPWMTSHTLDSQPFCERRAERHLVVSSLLVECAADLIVQFETKEKV